MRIRIPKVRRACAMLALLLSASASIAQEGTGVLFASSDGKGHISLLWFPPPSRWPVGGWKLSDSTGQILVPKISMGDPAAVQSLSVEDADAIRQLPVLLSKPVVTIKQKQLINILGLRAFSEPNFARALGLSWSFDNVAPGSRAYTVDGLDGAANPSGLQIKSSSVDSSQTTPTASAPAGVQAKVDQNGVSLFWTPLAENRQLPVLAYSIERDGGGQSSAAVTAKPVVAGAHWDAKLPLALDRNAPPNEMLTYRVFSVDVFGRRSDASAIRIFYPDFRALAPPEPVIATGEAGKIGVVWKAEQKPNLAGYVVERGFLQSGPYETLTAQALPASVAQYDDTAVRGGTTYYYRVRAVSPRGDLGIPSDAAAAQPKNSGAPPKVDGLTVDAGETRVRLTWKPVTFPIVGYSVERHAISGIGGIENWVKLNPHLSPEPMYDDYLGLSSDANMEYRVIAVAFDNLEGPPSSPVEVVVADQSVPESPSITGVSGADGNVLLSFVPASPPERTTQFLVLRAGRADDLGVVIGDPLPANARQFIDLYVGAGESYWYRLVAVDKSGNHSDPTAPVAIRVGSPSIPIPPTPTLQSASTPYRHVILQFQQPPPGFSAIVERQEQTNGDWIRIAGPLSGQTAVDNNPPQSKAGSYRLSYVSSDGKMGSPSPIANEIDKSRE
jgi:hypothetical protein